VRGEKWRKRASWAAAQEEGEGGARELGQKAEKKEGGERFQFFSFSKPNFQMKFLSKRYFVFKTIITIKMHQHVCIKNVILTYI